MDENIHKDKLDDFVKHSFENYSEDPPSSLWDSIETELNTPIQKIPNGYKFQIWKYAAVLLIFLLSAGIITQHMFYKEKLNSIIQHNNLNILNESKDKNIKTNKYKETLKEIPITKGIEEKNVNIEKNRLVFDKELKNKTGKAKILNEKSNQFSELIVNKKTGALLNRINKNNQEYKNDDIKNSKYNLIKDEDIQKKNQTEAIVYNEAKPKSNPESFNLNEIDNFHLLPTNISMLDSKELPFQSVLFNKIKRLNSGWYFSLMVSPSLTFESTVNYGSPDPKFEKHIVANQQEGSVYSTDYNLRAGKFFNSHWGVETGVCYSNLSRNASHKPDFRFKDRKHEGNGGPPDDDHNYDFTYELNTYGGSTSVNLRVASTDSTFKFKDEDSLNFKISTKETVRTLKIPFVGVYKLDYGRIGLIFKAGLIGNILLSNELQITNLETNSNILIDKDMDHPKPPVKSSSQIEFGYLFSLGAIYHINKHISIVAEPYYTGNFPMSSSDGRPLPNYYTVGFNTGLSYSF